MPVAERRRRQSNALLAIGAAVAFVGLASTLSWIGLVILSLAPLPFFVLGMALHPSRTHRWIGAFGVAGSLAGLGLLIYFLISYS